MITKMLSVQQFQIFKMKCVTTLPTLGCIALIFLYIDTVYFKNLLFYYYAVRTLDAAVFSNVIYDISTSRYTSDSPKYKLLHYL
jgi:hypothetical protein